MIEFEIILSLVTTAWSKETGGIEKWGGRFKRYQQIKAATGKQEWIQAIRQSWLWSDTVSKGALSVARKKIHLNLLLQPQWDSD